jgi:hypothetical protein
MALRSDMVIYHECGIDEDKSGRAAYHTMHPWKLLLDDSILFIKNIFHIHNIVIPMFQWASPPSLRLKDYFGSGDMDELYPSFQNIMNLTFHSILIVSQTIFLVSLPFVAFLPFSVVVGYILTFVIVNYFVCWLLNRGTNDNTLESSVDFEEYSSWPKHPDEKWIFINGVATGYVPMSCL